MMQQLFRQSGMRKEKTKQQTHTQFGLVSLVQTETKVSSTGRF